MMFQIARYHRKLVKPKTVFYDLGVYGPEAIERWDLQVEAWKELTDEPHPFGPRPPRTPSAGVKTLM